MRAFYFCAALVLSCALLINYTEACCCKKSKEIHIGLHGLGKLLGKASLPSLAGLTGCGCGGCGGCECDCCGGGLYLDDCGCGCDYDCGGCGGCGCNCGCDVPVIIRKKIKKKKKTIIKDLC